MKEWLSTTVRIISYLQVIRGNCLVMNHTRVFDAMFHLLHPAMKLLFLEVTKPGTEDPKFI